MSFFDKKNRHSLAISSLINSRDIFQISSRTNPLPANRGNPQLCLCGEDQENYPIFQCDITNPGRKIELEIIINRSLLEMKTTLLQWRESIENLEKWPHISKLTINQKMKNRTNNMVFNFTDKYQFNTRLTLDGEKLAPNKVNGHNINKCSEVGKTTQKN